MAPITPSQSLIQSVTPSSRGICISESGLFPSGGLVKPDTMPLHTTPLHSATKVGAGNVLLIQTNNKLYFAPIAKQNAVG